MDLNKECHRCGETKPLSQFYPRGSGSESYCKTCYGEISKAYRRTMTGFLTVSYSAKKTTSKKRGHGAPSFSKEEYIKVASNNQDFLRRWGNYVASGYNKKLAPSFDRKDNSKGYSWDNLSSWTTWDQNDKNGNMDIRRGVIKHGNKPQVPVLQFDLDGNFIKEHCSLNQAGRNTDSDYRNIWACCNSKIKSHNGFVWKYKVQLNDVR